MNISNLFGMTTFMSNLKLVLTTVGISSLLSATTLLILTIFHLKHKSRSVLTQTSEDRVSQPDSPASV
jgi:hypothetical protein